MNNIINRAKLRAQEQQLAYAGAVTPEEAFGLLQENQKVMLVDVRTNAERDWVGRVQIAESQHKGVQWSLYPSGTANPEFMDQLREAIPATDTIILFLCRSGVRSRHGAKLASEHGYTACFDILQGFEGDKDSHGHRKTVGGWCSADLPWIGA